MSDKVSDKTEYDKAKEQFTGNYVGDKFCDDNGDGCEDCMEGLCKEQVYQDLMGIEQLALEQGERREREKERPKDVYSEGLTVGMGLGRQQALKEVEQKVIQERNISVVKTRTTGYETAELIGFDKAIGVIKQAIDQLRRGGSE